MSSPLLCTLLLFVRPSGSQRLRNHHNLGHRTVQRLQTQYSQHGIKLDNFLPRFCISSCMNCDNLSLLPSKCLLCPIQDTALASIQPHCSGRELLLSARWNFLNMRVLGSQVHKTSIYWKPSQPGLVMENHCQGCFDVKKRCKPSCVIPLNHSQ